MRATAKAAAALAVAAGLLVLLAGPAAADPAEPGEYRSEVTGVHLVDADGERVDGERVEGEVSGVALRVVGGDSFLVLTVAPGVEVEVPGYEGEPYLRVLADGTVEENERSPSTYLNQDRYGTDVPAELGVDVDAEPRWVQVAGDGEWAWHDHRIHWMSPDAPPRLEGDAGRVLEWEVPIVVDGQDVVVVGTLDKEPSATPLPWLGLAVAVGLGGWFVGRRRVVVVVPLMTVAGGLLATFVGWREVASQPPAAEASPLPVVLGAAALVLAVLGAALALARRSVPADLCGLAAAAALGGWVLLRFVVLGEPVLVTDLAPWVDKAATTLVLAFAVTSAVLCVQGGAFASRATPGRAERSPSPGAVAPAEG